MAKLNTNSNAYTIIYASVLVVIVAFLLAFVASALKPTQDKNVALDTKKQILAALNVRDCADPEAEWANILGDQSQTAPILTANVNGEEKLVVAVKGAGLWGPIWGWIAINKDGQTVYGTFFNHEGETAGLGALIKEQKFQDAFQGKQIFADGTVALGVYKQGKAPASLSADYYVDAVTGATLTSNGVHDMIQKCLADNKDAIAQFAGGAAACPKAQGCCKAEAEEGCCQSEAEGCCCAEEECCCKDGKCACTEETTECCCTKADTKCSDCGDCKCITKE